jgi:hypothetical protein
MINTLNVIWSENFDGLAPLAYELKHKLNERWVRFHSLPESKRYPENESEYTEVLNRYNKILKEHFGVNAKLYVVIPEYSESSAPTKPEKKLRQLFRDSQYWRTVDRKEEYGEEFYWHFHVASLNYSGYELNALLRLVANDAVSNCFVVSESSKSLFHPYDGGSDSILFSTEERNKLKEKFSGWLSSHPEGF